MQKLLNEWREYLLKEAYAPSGTKWIGKYRWKNRAAAEYNLYVNTDKANPGGVRRACGDERCGQFERVDSKTWLAQVPTPYGNCLGERCYVKVEAKPEATPLPKPATPT